MINLIKKVISYHIVILITFFNFSFLHAQEVPLIYIVHSYEQDHVCGKPQADGVKETVQKMNTDVRIMEFFMDTKKTYTSARAIKKRGQLALDEIQQHQPQIVVTLDDNAFRTVGLTLVDHPKISVVFSGLNGQPESYHKAIPFLESREKPLHNITGIYEKLHLKRAISVIANTLPHDKNSKVIGITDYSPTGNAITHQFKLESQTGLALNWEVKRVKTFDDYKKLIKEINKDDNIIAIYPAALTLPTNDGKRVTAPDIFRWTLEHNKKPEVPLNYFFGKLGLFGGASVDFTAMGKQVGEKVVQILNGQKAGEIAIEESEDYAIVFNKARADKLNITIPEDVLFASDEIYQHIPLLEKQ